MRFSTILIASALAAVANAIKFTNTDLNNLSAGQPITLTWSGGSSGVSLVGQTDCGQTES
jgi:hypothetical protein